MSNMVKIEKGNVVLSISEEELSKYESRGYCKLGATKKVASKDLQKEVDKLIKANEKLKASEEELKKSQEKLVKENEELAKENEKLKADIEELNKKAK